MFDAGLPVTVVLSDRPCAGLGLAEEFGAAGELVDRGPYGGYGAAFDRAAFPARILNTHPALLPAFPGWHGVRDALAAGVPETGCTVHLATLEMDAGPILAQESVPVLPDDTEETLHERIKVVERALYPETIAWVLGELEAGRRIGSEQKG